jgi:two-component system response regulator NreC
MTHKILLVDDHGIMLAGLENLLNELPEMVVVGTARCGKESVALCRRLKPDLVIMDVVLPDIIGMEAAKQILAAQPAVKILALSMHPDRRYVIGMLRAGAMGYLCKESAFDELVQAIRSVSEGQVYISPAIGRVVLDYIMGKEEAAPAEKALLTERELEVLGLLGEGLTTKEVAKRLFLSHKTVHTHRLNIMEKLGVKGTAGLIKWSIKLGLTDPDSLPENNDD